MAQSWWSQVEEAQPSWAREWAWPLPVQERCHREPPWEESSVPHLDCGIGSLPDSDCDCARGAVEVRVVGVAVPLGGIFGLHIHGAADNHYSHEEDGRNEVDSAFLRLLVCLDHRATYEEGRLLRSPLEEVHRTTQPHFDHPFRWHLPHFANC